MLTFNFNGPYSWVGGELPAVENAPCGASGGVYLWTFATTDGELVYYVGETGRSFRIRFREHLVNQMGGLYRLHDPVAMLAAHKVVLWPGTYGSGVSRSLAPFLESLPELAKPLREWVRTVPVFLAPTDTSPRLRVRVESAIAAHLRAQPEPVGGFQDDYVRYRPRLPSEPPVEVEIQSAVSIRGLPPSLLA